MVVMPVTMAAIIPVIVIIPVIFIIIVDNDVICRSGWAVIIVIIVTVLINGFATFNGKNGCWNPTGAWTLIDPAAIAQATAHIDNFTGRNCFVMGIGFPLTRLSNLMVQSPTHRWLALLVLPIKIYLTVMNQVFFYFSLGLKG